MVKKAIVVGINAYDPPNALPSCVTDALTFAELLKTKFGFEIVGQLLDRDASKSNIIDGLRRLTAEPGENDELVFYYSGHGYRQQEGDQYVESIVPQDANFLTCQELAAVTAGLKPAALTVVFDSCHSGGMQKAFTVAGGIKPALVKYYTVPFEEKMKDFHREISAVKYAAFGSPTCPIETTALVGAPTSTIKDYAIVSPPESGSQRNFIMFSACEADETAAASTENTEGKSAFTYAFLSQLKDHESGIQDLMQNTGKSLRGLGLRQTPVLKVPSLPPNLTGCAFLSWSKPLPVSPSKGFVLPDLTDLWPTKPTAALQKQRSQKEMGMTNNYTQGDALQLDKGWLDSIGSIVSAAAPVAIAGLQAYSASSKDFEKPAEVDKAWFDTLTRTIATVVPAVVQGMQAMQPPSKAFQTSPAAYDKAWFDSITSVAAAVVPHIVTALKTNQQAGLRDLSAAAQKGWFDDVTHVVSSVLPVVIGAVQQSRTGAAQKGFQPEGVDDKSFWSTLGQVAQVAAPIALSFI